MWHLVLNRSDVVLPHHWDPNARNNILTVWLPSLDHLLHGLILSPLFCLFPLINGSNQSGKTSKCKHMEYSLRMASPLSFLLRHLRWMIFGRNVFLETPCSCQRRTITLWFIVKSPPVGATPVQKTTMLAPKPTVGWCVFLCFYGLGLPPVIEAVSGHQTKQFMTSSEFDLEFPERPLLERVEILWMNVCFFVYENLVCSFAASE